MVDMACLSVDRPDDQFPAAFTLHFLSFLWPEALYSQEAGLFYLSCIFFSAAFSGQEPYSFRLCFLSLLPVGYIFIGLEG